MEWVKKPEPKTVGLNETVTFACKGEGRPGPELPQWYQNGDRITGEIEVIAAYYR